MPNFLEKKGLGPNLSRFDWFNLF